MKALSPWSARTYFKRRGAALAVTAEPVEDEWQYVTDLGTVWRARLSAVAIARGEVA